MASVFLLGWWIVCVSHNWQAKHADIHGEGGADARIYGKANAHIEGAADA